MLSLAFLVRTLSSVHHFLFRLSFFSRVHDPEATVKIRQLVRAVRCHNHSYYAARTDGFRTEPISRTKLRELKK